MGLCFGGAALTAKSRQVGARRPYYFGTFGLFVLAALALTGVALTWSTTEAELAWGRTGRGGEVQRLTDAARAGDERALANAAPQRGAGADFDGQLGLGMNAAAEAAPVGGAGAPLPPMVPAAVPKPELKDEPAKGDKAEAKPADQRLKFDDAFKPVPHAADAKRVDRLREKEQLAAALQKPIPAPGAMGGFGGRPPAFRPGGLPWPGARSVALRVPPLPHPGRLRRLRPDG